MECKLQLSILPQPTDTTCGPTCLHAVYNYYHDPIPLERVIDEVPVLESGGTLAVHLANHALRRGYAARIYSYNLQLFDPTWFSDGAPDLRANLTMQMEAKSGRKLRAAAQAYIEYLDLGGEVRFQDLTRSLIRKHLNREQPILTGLSATFLHRAPREYGPDNKSDSIRGEPVGHFVVLSGYDKETKKVLVADPMPRATGGTGNVYEVDISRVMCSILLGIVTYDANLLVVTPRDRDARGTHA